MRYQAYGLTATVPANLRIAPRAITLTLMVDHPETQVAIEAPKGWRLAEKTTGVVLREAQGAYPLTIPAADSAVTRVRQ